MQTENPTGPKPILERAVIKAAIIEDLRDVREGLALLINGTEGYRCTGTFRSMEDALAGFGRDVPDVVLVDIGLPGMDGIEGVKVLRGRFPEVRFLMLTVFDDDARVFKALCAGANGYLLKKTPPARLLESLREAVEGGAPMSPPIARRVVELFRRVRPPANADHDLTPHEVRILKLLVEGHNYQTAAERLGVSVNTIATHIKHIYWKLHVHSKSEAVARALKDGLVD